jgi:molybdate transport system substrate-binding protein
MRNLLPFLLAAFAIGNIASAQTAGAGGATPQAGIPGSQITVLAPGGIRAALEQLIPGYQRRSGHPVKATFGSGLGTKQQIAKGEAFDVAILQPPYPEVVASGNVVAGSEKAIATVAVGIAVKKEGNRPDITTTSALKRALLAAESIAYPDPAGGAAAGVSFEATLKKIGIFDQVQSKLKRAQGGAAAMTMVAKGEAELGVTFLSEMNVNGIDIDGPLPVEVSTPTRFVGFVSAHAKDPAAAKNFIDFLVSPDAAAFFQANAMQVAH